MTELEGKIQIREMDENDCEKVQELFKRCFSNPWSLKSIKEMFVHAGYHNLVAYKDNKVIGYIGILTACDEADITNVAVDPDHRRNHVGSSLLSALLQKAEDAGIGHIFLEVRASNQAAIRLYEQAGFKGIDIRKNYYEHPAEDAIVMMW